MAPHPLEPYIKKEIDSRFARQTLHFAVSQSLFSSHKVDTGTRHLLKSLADSDRSAIHKILDLGCGYGPLGLSLAKAAPETIVHLVDRDALAVDFARHNADRNDVSTASAYGSLGYDDVRDEDFDLIVSNIPGKAGSDVIQALLLDAGQHLKPEGLVAIVVVTPLAELVAATLSGPTTEIVHREDFSAHTVFHYRFPAAFRRHPVNRWETGLYDRADVTFLLDELTIPMSTVRGLPEFDTLSYETILAYKALQDLEQDDYARLCVFNPRQGLLPVVLWRAFRPTHLDLAGRDLLGLRAAQHNLGDNGMPTSSVTTHHQTALVPADPAPDLVVGILRDDEGPDAIEAELVRAAARLTPGTEMLVIGGSTPITRALKSNKVDGLWRNRKRRRGKGNSSALLERR